MTAAASATFIEHQGVLVNYRPGTLGYVRKNSLRRSAADTPFVSWLVDYAEARGWRSGRQAAIYLGFNQSVFSTWVRGEVLPGLENQEKLAEATGASLEAVRDLVRRSAPAGEEPAPPSALVGVLGELRAEVRELRATLAAPPRAVDDAFRAVAGAWRRGTPIPVAAASVPAEHRPHLRSVSVEPEDAVPLRRTRWTVWVREDAPEPGDVVVVRHGGRERLGWAVATPAGLGVVLEEDADAVPLTAVELLGVASLGQVPF